MKQPLFVGLIIAGATGCATVPAPRSPAPAPAPIVDNVQNVADSESHRVVATPAPVASPAPDEKFPHDGLASDADADAINDLAAATPDARAVPEFDPAGMRWDIDVVNYATHPRVRYYLDYFQQLARKRMAIFLDRGAIYDSMIRSRFEREGLPGDLGYLALIESGYSSDAVSRANAVGMWQFMKGTGGGYGLRIDSWVDERRDPVKATDAAARHLHDLREQFGSLYLAAAAYNAGAGKVSRSLGKLEREQDDSATDDGSTDATTEDAAFFRLAKADLLAAETQDYVPKLIAAALIAKQPERYGFEPAHVAPFAYDSIVVSDVTGLDVVARLAGTSLTTIKQLNPQYLRLATPRRSKAVVRLPVGTGTIVAERYEQLPRRERVHFLTHVARRRERWTALAKQYHLPVAELRAANPAFGSRLKAGARVVIPTVAIPSALAIRATGTPLNEREPSTRPVRGARPTAAALASASAGRHRVRRGETLTSLARRYRVSVRSLAHANALPTTYALRTGMHLRIPD